MASLRVTPELLREQSRLLQSEAENLLDILDEINRTIQQITQEWDGLAQNAYFDLYQSLEGRLREAPEIVSALSEATSSAARTYEETDEQLQNAFRMGR